MRGTAYALAAVGAALAAAPLAAQRVEAEPAAGRWTLRTGDVTYRLAARGGELLLDYFGPAARDTSWAAGESAKPRRALGGVVEGRAVASPSLRLVAQRTDAPAPGAAGLRLTLRHDALPLEVEARWAAWGETGVVTQEVVLANRGAAPLRVESSPTLDWLLPPGDYTQRWLYGDWGQERQLASAPVGVGARLLEQTRGRSSAGYVPWLSLRDETRGVEYVADLAWSGNWWMRVEREPGTGRSAPREQPVRAALGIRHDGDGTLVLLPGDSIVLPRVALTASALDLGDAAARMHRWQRAHLVPRAPDAGAPLVQYNTWYALGQNVDIASAMRAADAAAALGAEVYIVDSGWYSSREWTRELGDYVVDRTKFPRGIEELAAHVRARGMRFGLWVEIENVGTASRLFREHPEWCLPRDGAPAITWDRCQLDFARPEVRRWARATVDRLVRAYGLGWIKIDYNIEIGSRLDPAAGRAGRRLHDHIAAYYAWLDELRAAYPELVVESCASGGLRFDTGIMAHAHATWISDMVDPVASLQLRQGCTLQFAPALCNHWMVGDRDDGTVRADADPGWWDFLFRVAMGGRFGISSRAWEWSPALRARAAANVALYKRIRPVIAGGDAHQLTPAPPDPLRPTGWLAFQYAAAPRGRSVVLAYRLARGVPEERFRLRGLDPGAVYAIRVDGRGTRRATGGELMREGLPVSLGAEWRAAVVELESVP